MNVEKQLSALTGSILALTVALGSMGCLQSAFDLRVENPALLLGAVILVTVLYAQALQWKHGALLFTCLLAVAVGYLYRDGAAGEQFRQLLFRLSTIYDRAYHWGVLQLADTPWDAGFSDLPLGIGGSIIALTVVRAVCCRKSVWLPVLAALIPVSACVVVTDTVPAEGYLLLLMTGLLLLILTSSVRRENALQGIRLTAAAALPVVLGLLGLFLAVPQERYVNHSETLRENVITAMNHLPQLLEEGLQEAAARIQGNTSQQIDLTRLGQRIPFTYPVMEVTAGESGTLYLRGQDFDSYDGFGWQASENRQEDFSLPEAATQTVTIKTRNAMGVRYLPYYPAGETILQGGFAENPEKQQSYTLSCTSLPVSWRQTAYLGDGTQYPEEIQRYLSLPDAARQRGQALLAGYFDNNAGNTEKADLIAALVMDSAAYSLTPQTMPTGEPDFALWFLEQGEKGYCIHFATAAAVLLRAADVPARYVTGYMAEAAAGETVTVTEAQAHAWAEYYEPRLGCWIPLEATPAVSTAAPSPNGSESTQPEETEQTEQAEQTGSTETPTLPTQPSLPESTQPPIPSEAPPMPTEIPRTEAGTSHWFAAPALILAAALLLSLQRSVRLELRRRGQRRGTPNQQALRRWQEAERLSRLLKESPGEELKALAQKAKFSQHQLTAEELQRFDSHNRSCLRRLKEQPWYLRLIYRYIYAAY